MTERCSYCQPEIETILSVSSPTLHQINTLMEGVLANGDLLDCKESVLICEPIMRLQKLKDKRVKEIMGK